MSTRVIDRVGVEIEGAWPGAIVVPDLKHDGSLEGLSRPYGEAISSAYRRRTNLVDWVKKNWPTETNSSCGFHIHVSLENTGLYSRMMEREFFDLVLSEFEKWGKEYPVKNREFWTRLRGENSYCKREHRADRQASYSDKNSDRYTCLNYCYGHLKTVELRLLPTFQRVETAIAALNLYIDTINNYLKRAEPESPWDIVTGDELTEDVTEETTEVEALCA